MRIGILPTLNAATGGIYQYSLATLRALDEWARHGCDDEFVLFVRPQQTPPSGLGSNWRFMPLSPPTGLKDLRRIVTSVAVREGWRWLRLRAKQKSGSGNDRIPETNLDTVRQRPDMNLWFRECGVELMLYPYPEVLSFETGIPYVMAIHDLQHRLQPEFPELSANGESEQREYVFRNGTRHAALIIADSEVGKEDILNCYGECGLKPDRVKVLPYLPAHHQAMEAPDEERQRIRAKYRLPERFLFYPAQFWPHKNHARIVQALGLLKREHDLKVNVAFSGSHSGDLRERTFSEMKDLAAKLDVDAQIHYLGYLPDEDMPAFYAEAVALVMPTFFGPTNIPPMEAWAFGCPVLTSDIRGIREQMGDAAVLVDPRSVESIAEGIHRLWTDEALRRTMAEFGRRRLARYTPEDFRRRLAGIIEEAKERVRQHREGAWN